MIMTIIIIAAVWFIVAGVVAILVGRFLHGTDMGCDEKNNIAGRKTLNIDKLHYKKEN